MGGAELLDIAAIDIIFLVLAVMGIIMGVMRGLGPVFGMLLWLLVSLWLAQQLTPTILEWMPNSPSDANSQLSAFGFISGVLLILPALARLLGGAGGKKKSEPDATHRPFGVLVGLVCAVLLFTLLTPFVLRIDWVSDSYGKGRTPEVAVQAAETASWFFPEPHRAALEQSGVGSSRQAGARTRR